MFWADTSSDPSAAPAAAGDPGAGAEAAEGPDPAEGAGEDRAAEAGAEPAAPHRAHDLPEVPAAEPPVADEIDQVAAAEAGLAAPDGVQATEPAAPDEMDQVAADEEFLSAMAAEFDAIQSALVRLDEGTFDTCQVCGGSIGLDRLMADPLLSRCPAHS